VYAKGTSDNIYVSATYTKEEAKQGAYGVTLKDANGNHAARFWLNGQGYVQMTGNISKWDSVAMKNELRTNNTTPTLWAQNGSSAIKKVMDTQVKGTANLIEWAVADNTLYCKVDGQISCIIPLSGVYRDWADGTQYSIALAAWNTNSKGKMRISDLNVLFGEDAKAKLPDKATVAPGLIGGTNRYMAYDALDGAYIPTYLEASAGLYGEAGTALTLETDMQLLDVATTNGKAGVSVRIEGAPAKTAEFLVSFDDGKATSLLTLKNLGWNADKYHALPAGVVPFDQNGYCHMKAEIVDDNIVISFNGQKAYTFALADYLDEYTSGTAVKLGIATNNSSKGITFFRNVTYTSNLQRALDGKYVSILGDSISTFAGVSNDASRNTTIANNAVEYTGTNCDVTNMYQTYWGQMLKKYNMNLLVNNSSGGNKLLRDGKTVQAGYKRVDYLTADTGELVGKTPDIILVHMGTNDYIGSESLGTLDTATIRTDVKSGEAYITPTTFTEAYVITLEKIKAQYPNAEVFCFTLSPSNYNGSTASGDFTLLNDYNTRIREIVKMYKDAGEKVTLVDTGSVINKDNYTSLTYDNWSPTHPNLAGMTAMAGKLEEALISVFGK
jgi:lysophospholipase L1-like esterase